LVGKQCGWVSKRKIHLDPTVNRTRVKRATSACDTSTL
jgi:hypothetical protein